MKIRNLTRHEITLLDDNNQVRRVFQSEGFVRLSSVTTRESDLFSRTVYGQPQGLPPPEEDTFLIVSSIVKLSIPERKDLVMPAEIVRDTSGRVIGCRSLGL